MMENLPAFILAAILLNIIFLGALRVAVGLVCEGALFILAQHILGRSLQNSKKAACLGYALGVVFLGLAVNFAFFV